jgi:hypothetical protein
MTGDVDPDHVRPAGLSDASMTALGRLSEALEMVERARGHLYSFHQLSGRADIALGDAVDQLRSAGHVEIADRISRDLLGRNVLAGRWTYQVVEEYDDGYWSLFRDMEKQARGSLADGRRHLLEAKMKADERSAGRPGHERDPGSTG